MLGLKLRDEFRGNRLKETVVEFSNDSKTGATEVCADEFLGKTYPTHDLLKAIKEIASSETRPIVVIGERGLGKSHLMATLYHVVHDPSATNAWLSDWANKLDDPSIADIKLGHNMQVITESLHRQNHKFLWDLLFEEHPDGAYIKGKWEGMDDKKQRCHHVN